MICNLNNKVYNKLIFVIVNLIAIAALYVTNINLLLKALIYITFCIINDLELTAQITIQTFYLTTVKNKSILFVKYRGQNHTKQIKVNFVKVIYANPLFMVLCFANTIKTFSILIIKSQISSNQFKNLFIFNKYGFIPKQHDACNS
jgi:hypothetical protein